MSGRIHIGTAVHTGPVTPAQSQYQDAPMSGSLPFTGVDLGLVAAVGITTIAAGIVLRRRAKDST